MAKKNAIYAQSGGVTSVINASAYGAITAAQEADFIGEIYGGHNGINGVLEEQLIDLGRESAETIAALRYTPAGAMGSESWEPTDSSGTKALRWARPEPMPWQACSRPKPPRRTSPT